MRLVIQRVRRASVRVEGEEIAAIGIGLLVFVGVASGDQPADAEYLAGKVAGLRVFEDDTGRMNRSVTEVGGEVLAVSQFTLLGDCQKGRRPSFTDAAASGHAKPLFEHFVSALRSQGLAVPTGRFGAHMTVDLVNDGPVTLLLNSRHTPDEKVHAPG